jgi:hypothetical protein
MATLADNVTNINQLTVDPNILDDYQSYTYNFALKLYESSVLEQNVLPTSSNRFVTIAQSGATAAFNIRRVEIESIPGVTRENKGALTLKVKMEIDEPLGFTFIDRILQAGKDLGLPTLNIAPYVLELSVVGWDENGNPVKPILATKIWVLNLTKVTPELRKGGSVYSLEFVSTNDQVQQEARCKTMKSISFQKASTLTGTLNNFAAAMTDASDVASEGTNYNPTGSSNNATRLKNIYQFTVQNGDTQLDQLSNWTMTSNIVQNAQRQFEVSPGANDPTQFQIVVQPGKDIFEILTALLANTNESYKFVSPPSTTSQAEFNPSEPTRFFHFDTVTTNQQFDPITGGFTQTHTITIVPKIVSRNAILTTTPGTAPNVMKLMSNNLLVKAYEYIFTGHNTSIIDLNMDFSTMWTDSMPLFISLLSPGGSISPNLAPNTMPIDNILPQIPAINKSMAQQNSNQTTPFALTAKQPDLPQPNKFLEQYPAAALTIESFARQEPDRDYSQFEKYTKGYSFPGDQASVARLSIFSYLADNSYMNLGAKPGVSAMNKINMTIRGDPFWLGIISQEVNSIYNGATYVTIRNTQRTYATYQAGEQNLYLKFRPPQTIDDNTGLMQFDSSSIFNTLYSVMHVNSIFENGSFRQELMANINRSFQAEAVQNTIDPLLDNTDTSGAVTPSNIQVYSSTAAAFAASDTANV